MTLFLTIIELFAQGYGNYPMYRGPISYSASTSTIWQNGVRIDTLLRDLGVKEKVQVETESTKNKVRLIRQKKEVFDHFGRIIEFRNISKYGDWFHEADYTQKNKRITKSNHAYSETIRNDHNRIIKSYNVYFKRNGKISSQRLNTYTYKYDKWIIASYTNTSSKDTLEMELKQKYFYDNDTGAIIKRELYKKGKLNYTYVYDCSLADAVARPKKDSTRVCQNEATDDRGYTYYTRFSYKDSRTYKSVSVKNQKNQLVESYMYIIQGDQELPTYIFRKSDDSSYTERINYSNNLKRKKSRFISTIYKNKKGQMERIVDQFYFKDKLKSTNYSFFTYNNKGLIKSSSQEAISAKGKVTFHHSSNYYYSYFNS